MQEVRIEDRQVLLLSGFPAPASVPILFDETFYNDQEQSYNILCISRPMEADPSLPELSPPPPYCLKSLEDVRDFLGHHTQKLDKFIQSFCQAFREQERKGLRHHIVGQSLFYRALLSVSCCPPSLFCFFYIYRFRPLICSFSSYLNSLIP